MNIQNTINEANVYSSALQYTADLSTNIRGEFEQLNLLINDNERQPQNTDLEIALTETREVLEELDLVFSSVQKFCPKITIPKRMRLLVACMARHLSKWEFKKKQNIEMIGEFEKIPIKLIELNQNDKKVDSGVRIVKLKRASQLRVKDRISGILLFPGDYPTVSLEDKEIMKKGLIALNGSWGQDPPIGNLKGPYQLRRLPTLRCANALHYGMTNILNTAEALAAALTLSGLVEQAWNLLGGFPYQKAFFKLNAQALSIRIGKDERIILRSLCEGFLIEEYDKLNHNPNDQAKMIVQNTTSQLNDESNDSALMKSIALSEETDHISEDKILLWKSEVTEAMENLNQSISDNTSSDEIDCSQYSDSASEV